MILGAFEKRKLVPENYKSKCLAPTLITLSLVIFVMSCNPNIRNSKPVTSSSSESQAIFLKDLDYVMFPKEGKVYVARVQGIGSDGETYWVPQDLPELPDASPHDHIIEWINLSEIGVKKGLGLYK